MPGHVLSVLSTICAVAACAGIGYYCLVLWSAVNFIRAQRNRVAHPPGILPAISILKPLRGTDPEMYESFRSHCLQDYPQYEVIFGVSDPADPAIGLVERLQREFPEREIRLNVCSKVLGTNVKVSNLAQMVRTAKYDHLLVNDSDIRVGPGYLRSVMAPFAESSVGLVTCLYRGVAEPTFGSNLEALGISTDFAAGVLAANQLEKGLHFALGSTLLFRKEDLERIGGYESLLDYLADDYELGRRISVQGKQVKLADTVVETFLPAYSLRGFIDHQLRWARTIREARPLGYLGLSITFAVPWALLALILSRGSWWAWVLLADVLAFRFSVAGLVGFSVLKDRELKKLWWLIPLRDCVGLVLWAVSWTGRRVRWRGDEFLLKDGRLIKVSRE